MQTYANQEMSRKGNKRRLAGVLILVVTLLLVRLVPYEIGDKIVNGGFEPITCKGGTLYIGSWSLDRLKCSMELPNERDNTATILRSSSWDTRVGTWEEGDTTTQIIHRNQDGKETVLETIERGTNVEQGRKGSE